MDSKGVFHVRCLHAFALPIRAACSSWKNGGFLRSLADSLLPSSLCSQPLARSPMPGSGGTMNRTCPPGGHSLDSPSDDGVQSPLSFHQGRDKTGAQRVAVTCPRSPSREHGQGETPIFRSNSCSVLVPEMSLWSVCLPFFCLSLSALAYAVPLQQYQSPWFPMWNSLAWLF